MIKLSKFVGLIGNKFLETQKGFMFDKINKTLIVRPKRVKSTRVLVPPSEDYLDQPMEADEIAKTIRNNINELSLDDQRLFFTHLRLHLEKLPSATSTSMKQELFSEEYFKILCSNLLRYMGHYSGASLIELLHSAIKLMPSPNCGLVRAALQIIRRRINDFDLKDLMDLNSVLTQLSNLNCTGHTLTLVKSLQLALPLATELRIEDKKFYADDIDLMTTVLSYSIEKKISIKSICRIMVILIGHQNDISVENARLILLALTSKYFVNNSKTYINLILALSNAAFQRLENSQVEMKRKDRL